MADSEMRAPAILPWDSCELEALLKDLVAHGTEAAKVDFKLEIEAKTPEQKADLLKDISAIANTYEKSCGDHGFLIFGVKGREILGSSQTEADSDKLQNHIEQLLRSYISPMPQIYLVGYVTQTGKRWGAIVIPPRNRKPHMFFKDLSCPDRQRARRRGEWFVRRGSTTDVGLPEDLSIIVQRQTELLVEPLRESLRNLQASVAKVEGRYDDALFRLVEGAFSPAAETLGKSPEPCSGLDLPARVRQQLRTPHDAIAEDLIGEAKAIKDFLAGSSTGFLGLPNQMTPPATNP
jgi:hypothetical protein